MKLYQWVEKSRSTSEKQLGGGTRTVTTYSYEKEWSSTLHDSSRYRNPPLPPNPTSKPVQDRSITAKSVRFGAYTLNADQINALSTEPIALPAKVCSTLVTPPSPLSVVK